MRGLQQLHSARVISAGHAFVQNLRRGHYELGPDLDPRHRIPGAFAELTLAIVYGTRFGQLGQIVIKVVSCSPKGVFSVLTVDVRRSPSKD
jgi:hypothetical protein